MKLTVFITLAIIGITNASCTDKCSPELLKAKEEITSLREKIVVQKCEIATLNDQYLKQSREFVAWSRLVIVRQLRINNLTHMVNFGRDAGRLRIAKEQQREDDALIDAIKH